MLKNLFLEFCEYKVVKNGKTSENDKFMTR